MAKRKVEQAAEQAAPKFEEIQAPSAPFWETYQQQLIYAVIGLAVLALCWYGYKTFILAPKQKEAVNVSWQAQQQFERDSFQTALNGSGSFDGFATIADKYSGTPMGNSANYYAGVCNLHLGDYDAAIKFMGNFSPCDKLLPIMKFGVLGDCYSEKQDFGKALDFYEKAAKAGDNEILTVFYLKKLGLLSEKQGKIADAKKAFERIRDEYPNSPDGRDVERYLARLAAAGQ